MQTSTDREFDDVNPVKVLSAWTALEVLSPQAFQSTKGDKTRPLRGLQDEDLPWFAEGAASAPEDTCYQLMLGTIDLADSLQRLIAIYGDSRPERPPMRGKAILASATADASGEPPPDAVWRSRVSPGDCHLRFGRSCIGSTGGPRRTGA